MPTDSSRGPGHDNTESAPVPSPQRRPKSGYLVVLSGTHLGELYALPPGRELILGRADTADIRLVDEGISRRHASIQLEGSGARLRDLGSHNGLFVEGERVPEAAIQDGMRVQLGFSTMLKYAWTDELEAEVQRKLARDAVREPLTGLFNRRHFEERLESAFSAARRHGRSLAALILDVDRFKEINDLHGHGKGDEVLVALARALQREIRSDDLLARIGGDEFGVIAEGGEVGARQLGEHLRRAAAAVQVGGLKATISVGISVSTGPAAAERGYPARALIEAADRALFEAKRAGRDAVGFEALKSP